LQFLSPYTYPQRVYERGENTPPSPPVRYSICSVASARLLRRVGRIHSLVSGGFLLATIPCPLRLRRITLGERIVFFLDLLSDMPELVGAWSPRFPGLPSPRHYDRTNPNLLADFNGVPLSVSASGWVGDPRPFCFLFKKCLKNKLLLVNPKLFAGVNVFVAPWYGKLGCTFPQALFPP